VSLFEFNKDVGKAVGSNGNTCKPSQMDLIKEVMNLGLEVENLGLQFDFTGGIVRIKGEVKTQEEREKVVLALGNILGVAIVSENLDVKVRGPGAVFCPVYTGDTLAKIAKRYYGNAKKSPEIFTANQPILEAPDKLYPGQILRIPPLKQSI